jgi:hypothetical protein
MKNLFMLLPFFLSAKELADERSLPSFELKSRNKQATFMGLHARCRRPVSSHLGPGT